MTAVNELGRRGHDAGLWSDPDLKRKTDLTPRQREVLELLAEGCSMKQAGSILKLHYSTVRQHRYALMERLGIKCNAGLIHYAIRHGIVQLSA